MSYNECLTLDTNNYLSRGCPTYALSQGSQVYFDQLFRDFYPGNTQLYTVGENNISFQDLLASMSFDPRIGKYTAKFWREKCQGISIDDNSYLRKICSCYQSSGSCNLNCNTSTIPNFNSTGQILSCPKNICIIDSINIDLENSQLGNISIDQACPFCTAPNSCICQISNFNIRTVGSKTGKLTLLQNCDLENSQITTTGGQDARVIYKDLINREIHTDNSGIKALIILILSLLLLILILVAIYRISQQPKRQIVYQIPSNIGQGIPRDI